MPLEKKIAFFWAGRMSWMRFLTLYSFRHYNPDWEIQLHYYQNPIIPKTWSSFNDADTSYADKDYVGELDHLNIDVINHVPLKPDLPPAHLCDIFQWSWLSRNSGYYADMDILWLQPMEEVHNQVQSSNAVFCLERYAMAIGFMGSNHCTIFHRILRQCMGQGTDYQHFGTKAVERTFRSKNPMRSILRRNSNLAISILPDCIVYPFLWNSVDSIFDKKLTLPKESVGLHWFGGHPLAQEFNTKLTPDNFQQFDNTFTSCLKNLI